MNLPKYFKLAGAGLSLALLSACMSPSSHGAAPTDPRHQQLLNMSVIEFYQISSLASNIHSQCAGISKNTRLDLELNERRNALGRGSFSAIGKRRQILASSRAYREAYITRHGGLCQAAQQELSTGSSPLSYILTQG